MDWMQYASEHKDWRLDFSGELLDADTIASVTGVTADEGLVVDQISNTDSAVQCWLSGGTAGQYYTVEATVVTAQGRTLTMEAVVYIR